MFKKEEPAPRARVRPEARWRRGRAARAVCVTVSRSVAVSVLGVRAVAVETSPIN